MSFLVGKGSLSGEAEVDGKVKTGGRADESCQLCVGSSCDPAGHGLKGEAALALAGGQTSDRTEWLEWLFVRQCEEPQGPPRDNARVCSKVPSWKSGCREDCEAEPKGSDSSAVLELLHRRLSQPRE
jgi:hypothetical protein